MVFEMPIEAEPDANVTAAMDKPVLPIAANQFCPTHSFAHIENIFSFSK